MVTLMVTLGALFIMSPWQKWRRNQDRWNDLWLGGPFWKQEGHPDEARPTGWLGAGSWELGVSWAGGGLGPNF